MILFSSDCELAKTSQLGQDLEMAKRLYQQTVKELQQKTKLEIQKAFVGSTGEEHGSDGSQDDK